MTRICPNLMTHLPALFFSPLVQRKEYSWFVTFLSMPGSFPDGTGNFSKLIPAYVANNNTLGGNYSGVATSVQAKASAPLGGFFSLTVVSGRNR